MFPGAHRSDREERPSLSIIDAQNVTPSHHVDTDRGLAGNKKIKERKQHVVVDLKVFVFFVKSHQFMEK